MKKLPPEAKIYIVQRLACFDTLSQVAKGLKEDMGIDISPQAVEAYDPKKAMGANLSDKLRDLFDSTRKQFLEDVTDIAISHKAVRLRALQRMAHKAEERGNMVLAASLLEQAAKECGDAFTNQRKVEAGLNVKGPVPLAVSSSDLADAVRSVADRL